MVLVSEAQGLRLCLECQAVLERGEDETAWMAIHLGGAETSGCTGPGRTPRHGGS